ncbi:hypothetical protein BG011_008738 [Mortierella polycephala]|uniref:C2 domain-containing protein n=1 Tax=Mortierella polycephala TaxID=41804 RepID=A0A9P6PQJ1_9FUNG|nr:hypothetical protein BG011_008738 [Mortierella polycephala]
MTSTLKVTVHRADKLEDVERFGKNDPYVQASLDIKAPKSFVKTTVKKNAGKNPEWNQTLTIEEYDPNTNHELYVEILDDETTIDEPIGFLAIPLRQVVQAPNHIFKGKFDVYNLDGKAKGYIILTLAIVNSGEPAPHVDIQEVQGEGNVEAAHQHRMKSLKNKEKAADGGLIAATLGGLVAGKFLLDQHNDDKKAKEAATLAALEQ